MVADIERKEIYRIVEPAETMCGDGKGPILFGRTTTIVEQEEGDFRVTVHTEPSDLDPEPYTASVQITYPMLEAMMIAHGQAQVQRGYQEAFAHLKTVNRKVIGLED